jgi:hypothetical protein
MPRTPEVASTHSPAWVVQTWLSFIIAVGTTTIGIYSLPVDMWVRGFMGMGLLFSIGSAISLSKTIRDLHEAERLTARIDDARVSRLIAEHDPMKPPA